MGLERPGVSGREETPRWDQKCGRWPKDTEATGIASSGQSWTNMSNKVGGVGVDYKAEDKQTPRLC